MLTLGLKLWSNNESYLTEAGRLAVEGTCDYIELYAYPDTFKRCAAKWKAIEIPYVIHAAHFVHGFCLSDPKKTEANKGLFKEALAFADFLGANRIIVHPGVGGDDREMIYQLNNWPNEWKARILIENKPYKTITDPQQVCNGHFPEAIRQIMEETGVGFCYDIGHGICSANSRKEDIYSEIKKYQELNPTMYHLSDGDVRSEIDQHKNLGKGGFDFTKIIALLDESKPMSLETAKRSLSSLEDFVFDVRVLRNKLYCFEIRPAVETDIRRVFEIANDPAVRASAINTELISWESHEAWYLDRISKRDACFWVINDENNETRGYVRYDLDENRGIRICTIALSSEARQRGLGTWSLNKSLFALRESCGEDVEAWVRKSNVGSLKTFERAGFEKEDTATRDGIDYQVFRKKK